MTELKEIRGRILYHSNYYDGPLTGVMLAEDGERYWFKVNEDTQFVRTGGDDDDPEYAPWRYELYALTADEWAAEDEAHAAFRELVGTHCDYDESGRRDLNGVSHAGRRHEFYGDPRYFSDDVTRRRRNYFAEREPVGVWYR